MAIPRVGICGCLAPLHTAPRRSTSYTFDPIPKPCRTNLIVQPSQIIANHTQPDSSQGQGASYLHVFTGVSSSIGLSRHLALSWTRLASCHIERASYRVALSWTRRSPSLTPCRAPSLHHADLLSYAMQMAVMPYRACLVCSPVLDHAPIASHDPGAVTPSPPGAIAPSPHDLNPDRTSRR